MTLKRVTFTDCVNALFYVAIDTEAEIRLEHGICFRTSLQFGIFGMFVRRHDPTCLQNGGALIVSLESFNFIIIKAIFGRFFSEKCYFSENKRDTTV